MPGRWGRAGGREVAVAVGLVVTLLLVGSPTATPSPGLWHSAPLRADAAAHCASGVRAACGYTAVAAAPAAGVDAWSNVTASQLFSPGHLVGSSVAYDGADNYLLLFGGCAPSGCPGSPQTWKYSGGYWTNLTPGLSAQPPARAFASMVYDSRDGYVLLFGGRGVGGMVLNDTWSFVGGSWQNLTNVSSAPAARSFASMAFDRVDNYVVLFGGCGPTQCPRNDTWEYIAGAWRNATRLAGPPPTPRYGAAFAYDAGDTIAVLFGGCGATCPLGDTAEFNRGHWVALAPTTSPPARSFGTMTYSGAENVTYLFGGNGSAGPLGDLWRFAAGKWTNYTGSFGPSPAPRFGQGAVESTMYWGSTGPKHLGYSLLFGGTSGPCPTCSVGLGNDTWVLEPTLSVIGTAVPSVVEVGQPASFSATGSGGSPPFAYLWRFGDASSQAISNPTHSYLAPGGFTADVTASDASGATADFALTLTVVPGPAVSMSISPGTTDVGRPVSFSGAISGGTTPYSTMWTFGDLLSSTSLSAIHSYGLTGNFSVHLHASDAVQGLGDAYGQVVVHALPSIDASVLPLAPTVGGTVMFAATESGGTGPFVFHWTFGDGNGSSNASTNHSYGRAGVFLASVTVTDAVGGYGADNFTVVVSEGPSGGGGSSLLPWTWLAGLALLAAAGIAGAALWLRRRRRAPPASLAAAPAEQPGWENGEEPPGPSKRQLRRDIDRFYRRRI